MSKNRVNVISLPGALFNRLLGTRQGGHGVTAANSKQTPAKQGLGTHGNFAKNGSRERSE